MEKNCSKKCRRCGAVNPLTLEFFRKVKTSADGFRGICKSCCIKREHAYRQKNLMRLRSNEMALYYKNREKRLAQQRKRRGYIPWSEHKIVYKSEQHQKTAEAKKRKYYSDINFRLGAILRVRLNYVIKNNKKEGSAVKNLGCTLGELKVYLQGKFKEGMSWDNWGKDGWHLDHIKPLSKFDLTKREEFLEAFHYTNLQPLWAKENLSKSNRV